MKRNRAPSVAALAVLAAHGACTYPDPPVDVVTRLPALAAGRVPEGGAWPIDARTAEELLETEPFEVLEAKATVGGNTGAHRLRILFPALGRRLAVKWKIAPPEEGDAYNNSPRRELASYQIQRWFLEPHEYVIPTIAVRCLPLAVHAPIDPAVGETFPGTACVLGTAALWLRDVHVADPPYDAARFVADARYAHHLANFNLVTYVIEHQDAKVDNFLAADDAANPRIFSVDNGITFGNLRHNYLVINWNRIHVPALTRRAIDHLRAVDSVDLARLATVAELHADAHGRLWPVEPGECLDADTGIRWRSGVLQLGLTASEIDGVASRIRSVLDRVDRGELPLLD
jgi:hypothetical protein